MGTASKTLPGETISGDLPVFIEFPGGVLVAAIDGLGHGSEAARASQRAAEALSSCANQTVTSVVKYCHEQLQNTRGAVMSLASFSAPDNTMTWLAVGNVEGYLFRDDASKREKSYLLLRGGVVGHSLPPLRAETLKVHPGDILVMVTDGIRSGFSNSIELRDSPQEIAERILAEFAKETDDAMVIIVRWVGKRQ